MAVIHTVDQAVVNMVATTSMKFSSNVQNLITYEFRNFNGSVSIRVEGRHITCITAQVRRPEQDDRHYDWASAVFNTPRDRPCVMDRDWMRDMFLSVNEIARGNIKAWYDMGVGFRPVEKDTKALEFNN